MSAVRGITGHACELFNEPKGLNNQYLGVLSVQKGAIGVWNRLVNFF